MTEDIGGGIEVQTGVPMPTKRKGKYPFPTMEVGDSFFVPRGGADLHNKRVRSAAYEAGRRSGRRYTVRAVEESGVKGVRVWRTE